MTISSSDTFIDPADVVSEADDYRDSIESKEEEIEDVRAELNEAIDDEDEEAEEDAELKLDTLLGELSELEDEAKSIFELETDCDNYAQGESLINEDYWVTYVQQLAEDIDGINTSSWPYTCIDWDQAASDLAVDYTTITFEGQDFYVRA
jgi:hypothetical protein